MSPGAWAPALLLACQAVLAGAASAATADCEALRRAYGEALQAAQHCDAASTQACAASRAGRLDDPCHCAVSVNPDRTQALDRLLADFQAQACGNTPALCQRMCATPVARCTAASGQPPLCGRR